MPTHRRGKRPDGAGADPGSASATDQGRRRAAGADRLRQEQVGGGHQVASRQVGIVQSRQDRITLVPEAPARERDSIVLAISKEPKPDGAQLRRVDGVEDHRRVEHGRVAREQRAHELGRHVGVRCLHPPGCPSNSTECVAQRRVEGICRCEAQCRISAAEGESGHGRCPSRNGDEVHRSGHNNNNTTERREDLEADSRRSRGQAVTDVTQQRVSGSRQNYPTWLPDNYGMTQKRDGRICYACMLGRTGRSARLRGALIHTY